MTAKEYKDLTDRYSPNSKSMVNIPMAFLVGGLICTLGEALINLYVSLGLPQDVASGTASVTLVFLSALLTGMNLYDKLAKHAGAGTLVPITGFANAMVAPAMEFKAEGLILGVGAKLFSIAGPVIVYGVTAAVVYGLSLVLFHLI